MSYSELEHFSNMLSGCESINKGDGTSPNSIYAQTVLKLHANDAGLYAGQEGFVEHVKKGAKNTKEWVMSFIAALKKYIKEIWEKVFNKIKHVVGGGDKGVLEATAKTSFGALKTVATELDGTSSGMYVKTLDKYGFKDKLTSLSELASKTDRMLDKDSVDITSFQNDLNKLMKELKEVSEQMSDKWKQLEGKVPKDISHDDYTELHNESEDMGWASVSVGRALGQLTNASANWAKKIQAAGVKEDKE